MRQQSKARRIALVPRCSGHMPVSTLADARDDCIEQLLEAIADIDRDDIHQAAQRLARVQDWIIRETERAAADPVFAALRLAS